MKILLVILTIQGFFRGNLSKNTNTSIVTVGDDVTLNCSIYNPTWRRRIANTSLFEKRTSIQNVSNRFQFINDVPDIYNLHISNVSTDDNDEYCCSSKRLLSQTITEVHCIKMTVLDVIMESPTHLLRENVLVANENENVTLTCKLSNHLTKGNMTLIYGNAVHHSEQTSTLKHNFIMSFKDDKKNALCCASVSNRKPIHRSIVFDIKYQPVVQTVKLSATNTSFGGFVSLGCIHKGNPAVKNIIWSKNGIVISRTPILERQIIYENGAGTYKCEVFNAQGTGSDAVVLHVKDFPEVSLKRKMNIEVICDFYQRHNSFFLELKHLWLDGKLLRHVNTENKSKPTLQLITNEHFVTDGHYICNVYRGHGKEQIVALSKDIELMNGYPVCLQKYNFTYGHVGDDIMIDIFIYGIGNSNFSYRWETMSKVIHQTSLKYNLSFEELISNTTLYGTTVNINTTRFVLEIMSINEEDFDSPYQFHVISSLRNISCSKSLIKSVDDCTYADSTFLASYMFFFLFLWYHYLHYFEFGG